MEDHNNEICSASRAAAITPAVPRAQIIITRTANPVRLPPQPAPRRQRRKNHSPSTASRSAAVPRNPSRLEANNAVNAAAPAVQRPRSPQRRSYKQHY